MSRWSALYSKDKRLLVDLLNNIKNRGSAIIEGKDEHDFYPIVYLEGLEENYAYLASKEDTWMICFRGFENPIGESVLYQLHREDRRQEVRKFFPRDVPDDRLENEPKFIFQEGNDVSNSSYGIMIFDFHEIEFDFSSVDYEFDGEGLSVSVQYAKQAFGLHLYDGGGPDKDGLVWQFSYGKILV